MEQLSKFIKQLAQLISQHRLKLVIMILSAIVFAFVLFPLDDLGDLVSSQVAKLTNNDVYVQFDGMNITLIPKPGLGLRNIFVDSKFTPSLKADQLIFTPSVMSLINKKPAGSVAANGFLRGDIQLSLSNGDKTESGVERQKISISAKQLSLDELRGLLQLPLVLKGRIDLETQALIDFAFQEQPDVEVNMRIEKFELPPSNLETPMGPLTLPDLRLSAVEIKGRLSNGRLQIEDGKLGRDGDELRGSIKGGIAVNLVPRGGGVSPVMGSYNFDIDLNVKKSFQDRAQLFLSFVDQYKTPTSEGARYAFKLNASSVENPPSFGQLR